MGDFSGATAVFDIFQEENGTFEYRFTKMRFVIVYFLLGFAIFCCLWTIAGAALFWSLFSVRLKNQKLNNWKKEK